MTITQISASYSGTLNLGDYNSVKIAMDATALLDEDESVDDATEELFRLVQAAVRAQAAEIARKRGARVEQIFAGLPVKVREQITKE